MACFDPRESENNQHAREAMAILCKWCRRFEFSLAPELWDAELRDWWAAHKARDAQPIMVSCPACEGTGKWLLRPGSLCACAECLGSGKVKSL